MLLFLHGWLDPPGPSLRQIGSSHALLTRCIPSFFLKLDHEYIKSINLGYLTCAYCFFFFLAFGIKLNQFSKFDQTKFSSMVFMQAVGMNF